MINHFITYNSSGVITKMLDVSWDSLVANIDPGDSYLKINKPIDMEAFKVESGKLVAIPDIDIKRNEPFLVPIDETAEIRKDMKELREELRSLRKKQ